MRKLRYHLVDVFTDRAFGGNPLAVLPHARGVYVCIAAAGRAKYLSRAHFHPGC